MAPRPRLGGVGVDAPLGVVPVLVDMRRMPCGFRIERTLAAAPARSGPSRSASSPDAARQAGTDPRQRRAHPTTAARAVSGCAACSDPLGQHETAAKTLLGPRDDRVPGLALPGDEPLGLARPIIEEVGARVGEDLARARPTCAPPPRRSPNLRAASPASWRDRCPPPARATRPRSPRPARHASRQADCGPASWRACRRGEARSGRPLRRSLRPRRSASRAGGRHAYGQPASDSDRGPGRMSCVHAGLAVAAAPLRFTR